MSLKRIYFSQNPSSQLRQSFEQDLASFSPKSLYLSHLYKSCRPFCKTENQRVKNATDNPSSLCRTPRSLMFFDHISYSPHTALYQNDL